MKKAFGSDGHEIFWSIRDLMYNGHIQNNDESGTCITCAKITALESEIARVVGKEYYPVMKTEALIEKYGGFSQALRALGHFKSVPFEEESSANIKEEK